MFEKILKREIEYPEYLSMEAIDLIDSIMQVDQMKRLGSPGNKKNDIHELKKHEFFFGVDFNDLTKYNIREMLDEEDKARLEVIRSKKKL